MFASSGFGPLRAEFPDQFIDTGINEPHTVTAVAGMVAAGGRAWVHIYSTFLQRAMDQVIHDIALQTYRSYSWLIEPVWSVPTVQRTTVCLMQVFSGCTECNCLESA